jgi:hypothetical protein
MADRFDARAQELGTLITRENGKKLAEGNVLDTTGFRALFTRDGSFNPAGAPSYSGEHPELWLSGIRCSAANIKMTIG